MSSRDSITPADATVDLDSSKRASKDAERAAPATADSAGLPEAGDAQILQSRELDGLSSAATRAMVRTAQAEDHGLRISWLLSGLSIALGLSVLAWSMPAPGIAALNFVVLSFALAMSEHYRARAHFRREVARAGQKHGLDAQQAARAAQAIEDVWHTGTDRAGWELGR
jgi:hypothetical protein